MLCGCTNISTMSSTIIVLFFLFMRLAASNMDGEFIFSQSLKLDRVAEIEPNGTVKLIDATRQQKGHVFYSLPIQFKNSSHGSPLSFSTSFVFAIIPELPLLSEEGISFVISPSKKPLGSMPIHDPKMLTDSNNGNPLNNIIEIELTAVFFPGLEDSDHSHVRININGLNSVSSSPLGYLTGRNGGFRKLNLTSGEPVQVWVDYNGVTKHFSVTISPIKVPKPLYPLLSLTQDLSPFFFDAKYVGLSSSTYASLSSSYILGWSFKMNGRAQALHLSRVAKLPPRTRHFINWTIIDCICRCVNDTLNPFSNWTVIDSKKIKPLELVEV